MLKKCGLADEIQAMLGKLVREKDINKSTMENERQRIEKTEEREEEFRAKRISLRKNRKLDRPDPKPKGRLV